MIMMIEKVEGVMRYFTLLTQIKNLEVCQQSNLTWKGTSQRIVTYKTKQKVVFKGRYEEHGALI